MTESKLLLPPKHRADVILDTDAYNEIDDQFAIAYLLKSREALNCIGLCAAPFFNDRSASAQDGMKKSYHEIRKLLDLLNRRDIPVFYGSKTFLSSETAAVTSPAADFIIQSAKEHSPDNPLYVTAIGAITNVASALLIEPDIQDRIVIVWLGGTARELNSTREFNMIQDIAAVQTVMKSTVPFVQLPCKGVVDVFTTDERELKDRLYGNKPVADYLVQNTVNYCNAVRRIRTGKSDMGRYGNRLAAVGQSAVHDL